MHTGKHQGVRYPGEHEAIISPELWDRAHAILATNYRARAGKTRAKTEALLRGLLRCAHCGCAMGPTFTRRRGRLYRYYLCVHASKHGYDSCPTRSLSAGEIEGVVIEQLRAVLRSPEILAQTYREAPSPTGCRWRSCIGCRWGGRSSGEGWRNVVLISVGKPPSPSRYLPDGGSKCRSGQRVRIEPRKNRA